METTVDPPVKYVTSIGANKWAVNEETNRISFLDARFYAVGDDYVPSVTTILDAYPKGPAFYDWLKRNGQDSDEIRDEAGRRGSVVHELTELIDRGGTASLMNEDGSPRYKLSEWAMLSKYVDFRERFPAEIHSIELNLASKELGYGGTLDRLMTIGGKLYLVDIKTSASVWPHFWLQLAAYHKLLIHTGAIAAALPASVLGQMPEIHLAVLHLNSKHKTNGKGDVMQGLGWQLVTQEHPTAHYLNLFEQTRSLWLAENGNAVPKMISYQLTQTLNKR